MKQEQQGLFAASDNQDVFVHHSQGQKGYKELTEGQKVEFDH